MLQAKVVLETRLKTHQKKITAETAESAEKRIGIGTKKQKILSPRPLQNKVVSFCFLSKVLSS